MALYVGHSLRRLFERLPGLYVVPWSMELSILRLFWGVCRRLSPERASRLGDALFRRLGPRLRKHEYITRNLCFALPNRTLPEIEPVAREVWGNVGATLAEYPHLQTIARTQADRYLEIVVDERIQSVRTGQPAIFVAAHLANWELPPAAATCALGVSATVLYSPQSNPLADRRIQRYREALGCRLLANTSSMRELFRELNAGRSLGFIIDQRIDQGELLPFFGVDAATTTSPARLALRFDCELIPIRVERLPAARFRITFGAPILPPAEGSTQEKALQMTQAVNMLFEQWIRERPGEWLCLKRRWPKWAMPKPIWPAAKVPES